MLALAEFLVSEARILERGSEQAKKEARDQIPSDRVKDAPAMARELRWRLKFAAGHSSDDDCSQVIRRAKEGVNGNKRKRVDSGSPGLDARQFRNFKPKYWDKTMEKTTMNDTVRMRGKAPGTDDGWEEKWTTWEAGVDGGEEAVVKRHQEIVVKVRRTAKGVERQRIKRTVEDWKWDDNDE
jgi:F-box/leucine-rich repeat protein 10/11